MNLTDAEKARKYEEYAGIIDMTQPLLGQLKEAGKLRELIEFLLSPDLDKGNFDIDAPEDCLKVCQRLLKEIKKKKC